MGEIRFLVHTFSMGREENGLTWKGLSNCLYNKGHIASAG